LADLVHRAQLTSRERDVLADADALRPLAGHRHRARWGALGTERLPGLLAGRSAAEPSLDLRVPGEAQEIAADYASVGLTLRRHPVALLRPKLDAWKVQRASDLEHLPSGRRIRVAGLVVNRQRPQTAKGTVFMTLEDETGSHNLIVWNSVLSEQRLAALGSKFLIVSGDLQKSEGVTHVVVRKFHDASRMVGSLETASRDFH
ncbi:MAG TPA: OB-fold nucleic acid binding domain-containing protein, partial [Nevskiaceae bacterium]|nr:OB-fold nucleic acid binding domain-containing protein [Nevskiaceae bacterium]